MCLPNGLEIRLHGRCHARLTTMTKIVRVNPRGPNQHDHKNIDSVAHLLSSTKLRVLTMEEVWIRTDAYTWQTSVVHCGTWLQYQMEGRELLRLRCPTEAEEQTISICIGVSNPDLSDD